MNIKETGNILDSTIGSVEDINSQLEKVRSNLHIRNVVSFVSKLTELTTDNEKHSHLVALEILSGTNDQEEIEFVRLNIIYKEPHSDKVMNTGGSTPSKNYEKFEELQSLASSCEESLFPEYLPNIESCIINVALDEDPNSNSEKLLNGLLTTEQKNELEAILLEHHLTKKEAPKRKMKV